MDALPDDVILAITEHLDISSMLKLAETNKRMHSIMIVYERSVMGHHMAGFTLPPTGDVFSSELFLRRPLRYASPEMVKELEKRDFRIDDILRNSTFINLVSPPQFDVLHIVLNIDQQERLYCLLKRAMSQCDHIADIAANAPCKPVYWRWYGRLNQYYFERHDLLPGFRANDPYTNYHARPHQRQYISGLPIENVAMLYYLVNTLSIGFLKSCAAHSDSDPAIFERTTVFEDSVLRHGSWFAWAHIRGDPAWSKMASKINEVALIELTNYETGLEGTLPGLKSALLDRVKELTKRKNLFKAMFAVVNKLVTGAGNDGEEDEETDEDENWG
ncbi:hypothetical protein F4677DRAFT_442595 [Hypoxylon crocopeplum]|nr:hypothetical protein F4677DRAFT_442595 [Hypoxylon crocopeplum]